MRPEGPVERGGGGPSQGVRAQQAGGEVGEQAAQVPWLHVEPSVVGDGDGGHHGHRAGQRRRPAAGLAGLRRDRLPPHHQLHHQLHRGGQRRGRRGGAHGGAGAQDEAPARRPVGGAGGVHPRPRRHHQHQARRHRPGRRASARGRPAQDRPVGAHRRVAAGEQAPGAGGVLGVHGEAGRDRGRGHRHGRAHLLRQGGAPGGQHQQRGPLPAGAHGHRQLLHRVHRGGDAGGGGGHVPGAAPRVPRRHRQPPRAAHRRHPHRHAHRAVRHHGHRLAPALAAGRHHQAHDGHRGDGRDGRALQRQDGDAHAQQAHRRQVARGGLLQGRRQGHGAPVRGAGFPRREPGRHRHLHRQHARRPQGGPVGHPGGALSAVQPRGEAHGHHLRRRQRRLAPGEQGRPRADHRALQHGRRGREEGARAHRRVRGPRPPVAGRVVPAGARAEQGRRRRPVAVHRAPAAVRPAAARQRGDHPPRAAPGREREDDHGGPAGHREGDREAAGDGHQHVPVHHAAGGQEQHGERDAHRRAHREGRRVRGRLPRAQVRDREAAAGAEAHLRHDRGRRERRAGAQEGGHRHRRGRRHGRGAERVGHRAHGTGAQRHRQRRAHQPVHLPADEELHHLRRVHHHPHRARVPPHRAHLEVRLRAVHGAHHRHPQRRHHHDHIQGPRQALAHAGLVEAQRDLRHRHRARHLHGPRHRALLLPRTRHRLLHGRVRRDVDQGERPGADGGAVPPSEHHQPGAHLRDAVAELVLRGAAGLPAAHRLLRGAAGGHVHRGVRGLGVLPHPGDRLGLGRRHLGLQHRHLRPARRAQVHDPVRAQRPGLGQRQDQVKQLWGFVSRIRTTVASTSARHNELTEPAGHLL